MYLMESAHEADRLEKKTRPGDTVEQLLLTGLEAGQHALDAGAGTGAVARTMAQLVGSRGSVTAFDASEARVAFGRKRAQDEGLSQLSFVSGDLYRLPFETGHFDYVWCRFVFEYLERPDEVLRELVRVTRVGGKVVVGDLDGNALFHHPMPPVLQESLQKLERHLVGRFDPHAGRKLFSRFRHTGLGNIRVHVRPYHLHAGRAAEADVENWKLKLQTLRPLGVVALGGEASYDSFQQAFLDHLCNPDSLTYSVLFLVEGVKVSAPVTNG